MGSACRFPIVTAVEMDMGQVHGTLTRTDYLKGVTGCQPCFFPSWMRQDPHLNPGIVYYAHKTLGSSWQRDMGTQSTWTALRAFVDRHLEGDPQTSRKGTNVYILGF